MSEELKSEVIGPVGVLTLDAPRSLNSLTLEMLEGLKSNLTRWESDDRISCLFLQGAGEKAFCAGGDVRRLCDAIIKNPKKNSLEKSKDFLAPYAPCIDFFSKEYQVDYSIHRYPKPIIVWGDGIVMGGGIGLFAGATHRVVTEKSRLAMPEIAIGLFPDVGGSWFLNRLPHGWGLYLAMTGTRINGSDALYLGMTDYFLPSKGRSDVIGSLQSTPWTQNPSENHKLVQKLLAKFSSKPDESLFSRYNSNASSLAKTKSVIEYRHLLAEMAKNDNWFTTALKNLDEGSPSSAHIIFEQLRRTQNASLEEVFRSELNLAIQCCRRPDFTEGVRALLVDKDQNPKWSPARLSEISKEWVDGHFESLWSDEKHPLKNFT